MNAVQLKLDAPRSEAELRAYNLIRYEALRKPHGEPFGSESSHPLEPISTHVLATVDGQVAGGCTWVLLSKPAENGARVPYARLRQIAVDPAFRRRGIGNRLVKAVEASARRRGAHEIVVATRNDLLDYYLRNGYTATGPGQTLFGTVEHTNVCKRLT